MVFRRSKQAPQAERELQESTRDRLKYPNPKILLIDVDSDVETALRAEGYNICTGSFGTPYRVPKQDGFVPVIINGQLPDNCAEQEIVVIDLEVTSILDGPQGEKHTSPGENDWWASCSQGVVDPRPRAMAMAQEVFDRILSHGGVFVIFAALRLKQNVIWGYVQPIGLSSELVKQSDILYDNWSFLSVLSGLEVNRDRGKEMLVEDIIAEYSIGHWLSEQAEKSRFSCTLRPQSQKLQRRWIGLATNKYRDDIAGMIAPEEKEASEQRQGWVFILPEVQDKPSLLSQFLEEILPDFAPHLFPHLEGLRWVQRQEYELPEIVDLRQEISDIREETDQRISSLEQAIENARADRGYLHDLIQATGRTLVLAVQKVLNDLGFRSVVDVDAEAEEAGDKGPKREDLQIHDDSLIVLVEVKGISQLPKDAAALQVWKYIAPRMREWGRTDIRGLSIVNHQRHVPALERENAAPFREDLLTNAEEHQFGLMTTWDLFRLVRSFTKNGWQPEHVKPLFYQNGRIEPVPIHYEFVGNVEHFWPKAAAVGVRVEAAPLDYGDRIAFELPIEFEEQVIESLQMDGKPVERVDAGQLAGIATHLTKEQARKGVRVFRVRD